MSPRGTRQSDLPPLRVGRLGRHVEQCRRAPQQAGLARRLGRGEQEQPLLDAGSVAPGAGTAPRAGRRRAVAPAGMRLLQLTRGQFLPELGEGQGIARRLAMRRADDLRVATASSVPQRVAPWAAERRGRHVEHREPVERGASPVCRAPRRSRNRFGPEAAAAERERVDRLTVDPLGVVDHPEQRLTCRRLTASVSAAMPTMNRSAVRPRAVRTQR